MGHTVAQRSDDTFQKFIRRAVTLLGMKPTTFSPVLQCSSWSGVHEAFDEFIVLVVSKLWIHMFHVSTLDTTRSIMKNFMEHFFSFYILSVVVQKENRNLSIYSFLKILKEYSKKFKWHIGKRYGSSSSFFP
jgi:hypothetical protein